MPCCDFAITREEYAIFYQYVVANLLCLRTVERVIPPRRTWDDRNSRIADAMPKNTEFATISYWHHDRFVVLCTTCYRSIFGRPDNSASSTTFKSGDSNVLNRSPRHKYSGKHCFPMQIYKVRAHLSIFLVASAEGNFSQFLEHKNFHCMPSS